MKKSIVLIVFFIGLASLAGCTKSQNMANNKVNSSGRGNFVDRRPDFGQPERRADLAGLVKNIVGNEVTILKIEWPDRNQFIPPEGQEREEESRPANLGSGFGGGRGMGHFGGGRGNNQNADMQAQMLERMKEMSVGEATVTIPVGIQMLKPDATDENTRAEMVEATLSDITNDKMIQVWLNEEITDRQIAEFVLIMR